MFFMSVFINNALLSSIIKYFREFNW